MKHILFLFVPFFVFGTMAMQPCFAKTNIEAIGGVTLTKEYFQTRFYGEFKSSVEESNQSVRLNSWAFQLKPANFFTLTTGTLIYGGIWSRFNNPAPLRIGALKQPYTLSTRLISNLPNKGTKTGFPSISAYINLPFLKVTLLLADSKTSKLSGGIGLSIPFRIDKYSTLLPAGLRGTISFAWRTVYLKQKQDDRWFLLYPYFVSEYFHSLIQELALKTKYNTVLFSAGFSQSPYGKPSGFIRTEYSLALPIFILNAHLFLSDIDYLSQNGNFERDTIRFAINPQLRFSFFGKAIRSIRIGVVANTIYKNSTDLIPTSDWFTSFTANADVQFVMLSIGVHAGIFDLLLSEQQAILQNDSLLKIQSTVLFRPWYLSSFPRTWVLSYNYAQYIKKKDRPSDLSLKGSFSGGFTIAKRYQFGIDAATEIDFEFPKKMTIKAIRFLCKMSTDISARFFNGKQKLELSAQTELVIKESRLSDITADFSVILKL